MLLALEACDANALRNALAKGADPRHPVDALGRTPLMHTLWKGFDCGSRILLPHSDPLACDTHGQTALMYACFRGFREIAEQLIPISDIHAANLHGETALGIAARYGQDDCLRQLLPVSDLTRRNRFGDTPSDTARACGNFSAANIIDGYLHSHNERRRLEQDLGQSQLPGLKTSKTL